MADEPPPAVVPLSPSATTDATLPAPPRRPSVTELLGVHRCTSQQLCWDPEFNRMDLPEMVFTGAAAGVTLAFNIVPPLKTGWTGGILVDNQVRSALRLHSITAEYEVRSVSDLGLAIMMTYPVLVDSLIVAYWYRGSPDVGLQTGLIDTEAFFVTAAVQAAANFFSGRARPYSSGCGTSQLPGTLTDCEDQTRYRSFFSGHSALSFTSAALICAHHEALRLFDNGADHFACAAGFVAASAVAAMRIMGDEHYFSDVFVGAVVGTTVGLSIPLLHHYSHHTSSSRASTLRWTIVPSLGGAQVAGVF
jgi:membrane-associated phospholipid phosphatase